MEDIIDPGHGISAGLNIAHIANKELYFMSHIGESSLVFMTHVILFFLVAREDANLLDIRIEESTKHGVSETARTACNQQDFVFED
jgi:hypothetical protein